MKQVIKSSVLAIVAALGLSSAALAGPNEPADMRVAYGDLDLSQPGDAWTFQTRVSAAVDAWCEDNQRLFIGERSASPKNSCRKAAMQQVRVSLKPAHKDALRIAAAPRATVLAAAR